MLSIYGPRCARNDFCDRVSRRNFIRIGALGTAGLTLPQLLAAESQAGIRNSHKSVILIYLVGGPPHQDMFDLKPEAPSEIAGPHRPIQSNVPGIEICELFPRMARMMDKFTVIRSLVGAQSGHDAIQCYTGRTHDEPEVGRDHWPRVAGALLAGGGMRNGQVIGATDRLAGEAISRPVTFGEVFATLYHNLGIDIGSATITDTQGRPHYLVDRGVAALQELV